MDAALRFPTSPAAVKAAPVMLGKRMSAEQAFTRILGNCLAQIGANVDGVVRFRDVESLHQMRVGLRRLRAALALFDALLPLPLSMATELDWFAGELGAARDWDVLLETTLPATVAAMPDPDRGAALTALARERSGQLHAQLGALLLAPRYQHLMAALERWLERRDWRDGLSRERRKLLAAPASELAAAASRQGQRRLKKRARKLRHGGAAAAHRLRLAAKRSRYATEFFLSLLPRRRARACIAALAQVQDALGAMNDAQVADRLLGELAGAHPEVAQTAAFACGVLAARTQADSVNLHALAKQVRSVRLPG
ncbi:MAG TPA: CHAD domain-containing protein [Telluria sp.]|jgi:CHAD domain-containing protein